MPAEGPSSNDVHVNLSPAKAWNNWFKITLVLTGLCCSLGVAATDGSGRPVLSEDALGFGEGGLDSPLPVGDGSRSKPLGQESTPTAAPVTPQTAIPPPPSAPVPAIVTNQAGDTARNASDLMRMSRDELFQKVFQRPMPARLQDLVVYLIVDDENLGQVRIHWNGTFEDFSFVSPVLKSFLDTALLRADPRRSGTEAAAFSGKGLKERRFDVRLDETEFTLSLTIPPELKKRRVRSIEDPGMEMVYGVEVSPAKFSAYLNSQWQNAWIYRERFFPNDSARLFWERYNGNQAPERQPWSGDLDGAIRVWDWVLKGEGSLMESDSGSRSPLEATRGGTKLVHDFVPWNSRLTLLDVSPKSPGGNFSLPGLLGADLELGNALYSRRGNERAKVNIFLERPADVTVLVNGVAVRTIKLGSGSQTIQGIPGRPGLNIGDVQLAYADGRVEHVPFEFTQSAPEVLPEGRREGSFSAGVRRIGPDDYGTTAGDVVVSGSYRQGWSPFLNQELGVAVSRGLQVANLNFLWIDDSVTTWNLRSTFSLDSLLNWGQRHDLNYSLKIPNGSILGRASYIQSQFRNSFFAPTARQKVAVETGLNVSVSLWKGAMASDLSVQFNRKLDSATNPIDYRLNLSYALQAYRGLNLRASAGFTVSSGEYVPAVSITANYFFNTGRHSFFAMNQMSNQKQYVAPRLQQTLRRDSLLVGGTLVFVDRDSSNFVPSSYRYTWRNQSTGGWSWSEGVGTNDGKSLALTGGVTPDQYGLQLSGQKTINVADFGVSYNLTDQSRQDIMSRSHYLLGRMSTSLMFADGVFAIGRPVRDGFLLVKGKQDMERTTFRVNPSDLNASEYSRGGPWNAASYGMLTAYQTENVQVVAEHTPGALSLDGNLFSMRNTYQQGYVLRLGRPAQVFVRMRLIDQASQPLSHTTFQVFSLADTTTPMYRSFSNEDGIIQVGGMEPGKQYIIRFGEDAFVKDLRIAIPKNAPRMYEMGDVKVENQSLSQLSKITLLTNPDRPAAPTKGFGEETQGSGAPDAERTPAPAGKDVY